MPRDIEGRCEAGVRLATIAGRWKPPVLDALRDEGVHFLGLLRAVDGVSRRMLTLTLRELERDGLLTRSAPTGPQGKVTYELTASGHAAVRWLDALV